MGGNSFLASVGEESHKLWWLRTPWAISRFWKWCEVFLLLFLLTLGLILFEVVKLCQWGNPAGGTVSCA